MLNKCGEGTRYIHRKQFKSALVPNTFSVAYARRDEPDDRESRPGGETILRFGFFYLITQELEHVRS